MVSAKFSGRRGIGVGRVVRVVVVGAGGGGGGGSRGGTCESVRRAFVLGFCLTWDGQPGIQWPVGASASAGM